MIKTETAVLTQKNHDVYRRNCRAYAYSMKRKQRAIMKGIFGVVLAIGFIAALGIVGKSDMETAKAEEQYNSKVVESETEIVGSETRTMEAVLVGVDENGSHIIQTGDGNQWTIQDPPEVWYEVTIDSNGTEDVKDDVVVGLDFAD